MSIEDVKHINELAQSLLDQRIVASREDAIKQAEMMLNRKLVEATNKPESSQVEYEDKEELEKCRNIIQRNKEYMDRQLFNFKHEIENLNSIIITLRKEIDSLKTNIKGASIQEISESKFGAEKQVKQQEEKKESHPRQGNFTSKDVSIEKMFYFGKK